MLRIFCNISPESSVVSLTRDYDLVGGLIASRLNHYKIDAVGNTTALIVFEVPFNVFLTRSIAASI